MSTNQKFILGEYNEFRTNTFSDDDHNSLIHLYENTTIEQFSPAGLELDALWEMPPTKAVLIELFFHSLSTDDLLSQFHMRMQQAVQEKANQMAVTEKKPPQELVPLIQESMYNFQASPDMSEILLKKALSRLISYGLIQREASAVTSKKTYYAITEDMGEYFVQKMLVKEYQDLWRFFEVCLICQKVRADPINRIKLLLKWLEVKYQNLNSLLFLFGSRTPEGQIRDNPLPFSEVIKQYTEFLVLTENYNPNTIQPDTFKENVLTQLDKLIEAASIFQDLQTNLIHITPKGIQEIYTVQNEVDTNLMKLEFHYLLHPGSIQAQSIQFTENGQNIIEYILREVYTNEDRLLKPPIDAKNGNKIGKSAPIYLQMRNYQEMYKNSLQVHIKDNEYYGFRKEFVKIVSKKIGPISVLMFLCMLSLIGGLFMMSYNMRYSEMVFAISFISFFILLLIFYLRNKWDRAEYMFPPNSNSTLQTKLLERRQMAFEKGQQQITKDLERRKKIQQMMMMRQKKTQPKA